MTVIGLGSVTIVAMFLWFVASLIGNGSAKVGVAAAYLVAILWTAGLIA